jgi:aspartate/tyrosine/aromatic aminotransferase
MFRVSLVLITSGFYRDNGAIQGNNNDLTFPHQLISDPTWGNHKAIFTNSGLKVKEYAYYNATTSDLDFDKMIKDIKDMPEHSTILLHACAHNPTG